MPRRGMLAGLCRTTATLVAAALGTTSITVSVAEETSGVDRRSIGNDRPFAPFAFVQAGDPQMGFGPSLEHDKRMFIELGKRAEALGAAFVLVCGDLVHKGRSEDWRAFDEALATFELPVKLVPGNHDLGNVPTLRRYRRSYGADYYSFAYNNCAFIGLNAMTLIAAPPAGKDASGQNAQWQEESRKQWQWLEETLGRTKRARRAHVILVMHHPPFVADENEKDAYYNWPRPVRKRLLGLVRRYGVHVILCGHTHKTFVVQPADSAFTIYSLAGTSKAFDKHGFGLRLFRVTKDRIDARVIRLDSQRGGVRAPSAAGK